eukprot:scaffold262142_cov37-Tisochrysis_lutea.AAC.3
MRIGFQCQLDRGRSLRRTMGSSRQWSRRRAVGSQWPHRVQEREINRAAWDRCCSEHRFYVPFRRKLFRRIPLDIPSCTTISRLQARMGSREEVCAWGRQLSTHACVKTNDGG